MATRFGAVSPAHTYATKVRWVVGCLVSVILVLAIAIVIIAQNTDASIDQSQQPAAVPNPAAASQGTLAPTIDVLVAASRIEEGARLEPHMFNAVPMDADKTPMAVVRAADRDTIVAKFAGRMINANMPIVRDDVVDSPPLTSFHIPPGYRASTITVDARSGVEGFAKPNSRVDVLWTYAQDGRKKVATISRFVKVLSVSGITKSENERTAINKETTVTLLVTEKDAKKIELARTLGQLSLSLVGDQETVNRSNEPDAITIQDLVGRPAQEEPTEVANDGVMYTSDPRSGRQLRYVLRNGRWALDRSFSGE
ncbi:MAG: Flp pilus assembly protein CpaB [Bdellovibrionales bacterium]|nr:Flp pilus assembly protein CpaB [Bdellovibrionales bacterium]